MGITEVVTLDAISKTQKEKYIYSHMRNLDFYLYVCHENRKEIMSRKKESLKEWGENEAKIHMK